MGDIKLISGCIACLYENFLNVHTDIHHQLEGNRKGHRFTVGLCKWHHQGYPWPNMTMVDMKRSIGPSMALNPRLFKQRYGSDLIMLEVQDLILTKYARMPWGDYDIPDNIAKLVRDFWHKLKVDEAQNDAF